MSKNQLNKETVLCKYFMNGVCHKGSACEFSHNIKISKPNMVCTFYKNGSCTYGLKCRYDHSKEKSFTGPNLVKLTPRTLESPHSPSQPGCSSKSKYGTEEWVDVAEFVPRGLINKPSYSNVVQQKNEEEEYGEGGYDFGYDYLDGGNNWNLEESDLCEFCLQHPKTLEHTQNCKLRKEKEEEKEIKSKNQVCGICMEVVWEKEVLSKQRFGILSHCFHVFCLECIRKWRNSSASNEDVIRLCPECRVMTHFIIPSRYFCTEEEEKQELIQAYRTSLRNKPCKYFSQNGFCHFNKYCFYDHIDSYGQRSKNVARFMTNWEGESDLVRTPKLSDFIVHEEISRTF